MNDNWGYVIAGYAITGVSLIVYTVSIKLRARRARALLARETPSDASD
jgi:hypothetical protein